jgi:methyl-accepting chemotaxis protein
MGLVEMSIKRNGQIGGALILGAIAVTGVVASIEINQIRFGGPIQVKSQLVGDLVADILPPPEYVIEPYLEATLLVNDPSSLGTRKARIAELHKQYDDRHTYWSNADLDPTLKQELVDQAGASAKKFWDEIDNELIPAIERKDDAAMRASYARLSNDHDDQRSKIDKLIASTLAYQTKLGETSYAGVARAMAWLIGIGLIVTGLLVAGLWYVMKRALLPLSVTADAMQRMAAGDFDVAVPGADRQDEIGAMAAAVEVFRGASRAQAENEAKQRVVVDELARAMDALAAGEMTYRIETPLSPEYESLRTGFNRSIAGLGEILSSVSATAASVHSGASEIRAASDDLALRTEQQAASLEEAAAAMNQVTTMVRETAKGAAEVSRSIDEAHREASEGGAVVKRAVGAMGAIEKSASEITQIINVIDGIAFQTNLLALNAGVEAARAGDAGKGFAVVANEVRALAQRSADAAKDIKGLITTSAEQVGAGVSLVGETGTLLDRIQMHVSTVSTMITTIAESAETQATNLQQVNGAVGEMDKMTQQNAAMVEESTAAARSLASEAETLADVVSRFKLASEPPAPRAVAPTRLKPKRKARAPMVSGNLALKSDDGDDNWSEF